MTSTLTTPTLASLAEQLRGELVLPGDTAYDEGRHVWNGMFDGVPQRSLASTAPSTWSPS